MEIQAEFSIRQIHNPFLSGQQNKPIYDNKLFVKIAQPGDNLSIVEREASAQDKQRFAKQLKKFENLSKVPTEGTPIQVIIARADFVAIFKEHDIHTIEELANISAEVKLAISELGPRIGGEVGVELYRVAAIKYLDSVAKGEEHQALKSQIAFLTDALAKANRTIENYARDYATLKQQVTGKI